MKSLVCALALLTLLALGLSIGIAETGPQEAPAAFDGATNGLVDAATHTADAEVFDEVEEISDGLGPLYNAQSCRECHQNPQSGGISQVTELRVGHLDSKGNFVNPSVPIADGSTVITGRTLINDRAICPNGEFPDAEIQERVPDTETIRTLRTSLNLLGDGFVEAVADETLNQIATSQCHKTHGRICGKAISVPVLEAPGKYRIGRFGWKDQQATLLSFAGDAYLNEMGITNRLQPTEVTTLCDTVKDPEDVPGTDGLADIDHFARFMRATKVPPRDVKLSQTEDAKKGSALFDSVGCAQCHVRTMQTVPAGTQINGGTFTVPPALGDKIFHPFSDFLLHNVGTGDGIVIPVIEHYGMSYYEMQPQYSLTANRMRTPPLWGVRTRSRLMHDGKSLTFADAILRHRGEASLERKKFIALTNRQKRQLITFLKSL
ncbi:MAG TPA: di-heme oxidoredictase family protein [Nitrospirota bacterium]|nr:di-heme oxidoredictase family protein [Nitrospirota bacterium]